MATNQIHNLYYKDPSYILLKEVTNAVEQERLKLDSIKQKHEEKISSQLMHKFGAGKLAQLKKKDALLFELSTRLNKLNNKFINTGNNIDKTSQSYCEQNPKNLKDLKITVENFLSENKKGLSKDHPVSLDFAIKMKEVEELISKAESPTLKIR